MLRNNRNMEIKKSAPKLISIIMVFVLCVGIWSAPAYGAEQGTAANPYMISTAAQLQAINNKPDACYKLAANIDMTGVDFVPIGNVDVGAFTGSFDGSGYTISNLTVDSGKYAGLFGYNEGVITDVTLSKINVQGTRYAGGVAAYNGETGTISKCKVKTGKISVSDGLASVYVGGVTGYNNGIFEGYSYNGADIDANSSNGEISAGGIIGESGSTVSFSADNRGKITVNCQGYYSWTGGIIGWASNANLYDCTNYGNIRSYAGKGGVASGLIGSYSSASAYNCGNNGDVTVTGSSSNSYYNAYGIRADNVYSCYNTGSIYCTDSESYSFSFGYGIYGGSVSNSFNSGKVYGDDDARGISGAVSNSYNTGNITRVDGGYGIYGGSGDNNYNSGNCKALQYRGSGRAYSLAGAYPGMVHYAYYYDDSIRLSKDEFCKQSSFKGFDFDDIWTSDSKINSGFPTLRSVKSPLVLNRANDTLHVGDSVQLVAYKDGVKTTDVSWKVVSGSASVTSGGKAIAVGTGYATISCRDNAGNRANYNVYIVDNNTVVTMNNFSVHVSESYLDRQVSLGSSSSNDFLINADISDKSIAKVLIYDNKTIRVTLLRAGTATLSFETAAGAKNLCTVTVTNPATGISLPSSMTVARSSTKKLIATTNPASSSSNISWSSSDADIATVDQKGNVKGIAKGTAVIKAVTDNGYSAQCTVTVNVPITSMSFDKTSVTVYKDDIVNLKLTANPLDTTDYITYSCSSDGYVTFSEPTHAGVKVTGNKTGTVTVKAISTSGIAASCQVKIIDHPVIVTDVSLNETEHDAKVGEVFKLNAAVTPSNATNKKITWASTDETVASVSEAGTVTAVGAGKTVITATSSNGVIAWCDVTVTGVASTNLSKIYIPQLIAGDEKYVDIPIMIENNPGISFASLRILYNSDKLDAVSISNGDIFESVLGSIDKDKSVVRFDFTSEENKTDNGILAKIRFELKSDFADNTDIKLCYYPGEIRNFKMNIVSFNLMDGLLRSTKQCRIEGDIYSCDKDNDVRVAVYDKSVGDNEIKADLVLKSPKKGRLIELTDEYRKDNESYIIPYGIDFDGKCEVKIAVYKKGYGASIETVRVDRLVFKDINLKILGDINEDDSLGIGDSVILKRYIAGWEGYENLLNREAADINGDGKIDFEDLTLLERHIAGWKGYEQLEYGMKIPE